MSQFEGENDLTGGCLYVPSGCRQWTKESGNGCHPAVWKQAYGCSALVCSAAYPAAPLSWWGLIMRSIGNIRFKGPVSHDLRAQRRRATGLCGGTSLVLGVTVSPFRGGREYRPWDGVTERIATRRRRRRQDAPSNLLAAPSLGAGLYTLGGDAWDVSRTAGPPRELGSRVGMI
jgi:hypothetical protein